MITVNVNASKEYKILIDNDLLKDTGELVCNIYPPCKAVIITDDIVDSFYAGTVQTSLEKVDLALTNMCLKTASPQKAFKHLQTF